MTATIPFTQSRFAGHAAIDAELAALYERAKPFGRPGLPGQWQRRRHHLGAVRILYRVSLLT
ncbi:MAG: hypothetical protein QM747_00620, partial [Nocardioides sp.]